MNNLRFNYQIPLTKLHLYTIKQVSKINSEVKFDIYIQFFQWASKILCNIIF